jgi:hypothetical protein
MDDRQKLAAAALAEGKTTEMVANEVGRNPRTIHKWLADPEFQAAVIRGVRGVALYMLAQNLKYGGDPKVSQAALATLRWLGVGKTKPRGSPKESPAEEDETDLGEFSEESLRKLKGEP